MKPLLIGLVALVPGMAGAITLPMATPSQTTGTAEAGVQEIAAQEVAFGREPSVLGATVQLSLHFDDGAVDTVALLIRSQTPARRD